LTDSLTRPRNVVLCLIVMVAAARADDWPQWGGCDGRAMASGEKGLPESFVPGKKRPQTGIDPTTTRNVRWGARLGHYAYGNLTVAGGRVFVGTDDSALRGDPRLKRTRGGMVHCFDEATGALLWRLVVPKRRQFPRNALYDHQHLGVCSSPTVDGDRVYVMTCATEIVCLDAKGLTNGNDGPFTDEGQYLVGKGKPPVTLQPTDADIIWRYDLIDELGVVPHDVPSCSVLVHGRFLYTSSSNGVNRAHTKMMNADAPSFVVLDKMTGKLVATDDHLIGERMWHCQWSPPSCGTVGGRTLIFFGGGDGFCYAFEPIAKAARKPLHLKKVWAYDCNPPRYRYRDGKPIPYYDGDKRRKRGGNISDGTYVGPSQVIATPAFCNGRIYVAIGQDPLHGRGRGMLSCIDAATGTEVWSYDGIDRSISTVAVSDGLAYAPDIAGRLHCLDADTGKLHWMHDTRTETWGSPLVADGKVYYGTKKHLWTLAHGTALRVLSKVSLGSPLYGTPVAANGVLYVASNRYLWAVERTAAGQ